MIILKEKSNIQKDSILDKLNIMKIHGKCMEKDNLFGMINHIIMEVLWITKDMGMQWVNFMGNLRKNIYGKTILKVKE